jgi:hypothetical protein
MLEYSASAFFWCGRALRSIREDALVACSVDSLGGPASFHVAMDLDDRAREKAIPGLKTVETECRKIGMAITADTVVELIEELEARTRHSFDWLHTRIDAIERLAEKELRKNVFLHIPPDRARFLPLAKDPHIFGQGVADSFPSTTWDAAQAGYSMAMRLGTAAVFHLMRVLEIGLSALGDKFAVSLAHTNWAPAIEEIERKIRDLHKDPVWRALPDYKLQQEFYAQAASHFGILKDAWRNYTMHIRGKYTEDEAEQIFMSTKAFMQRISMRLKE